MSTSTIQQSSVLPAAQPVYIFRGHGAQIHSLHFYRDNLRLISGDAEGWIVIWDTVIKRPKVVWRAHQSAILRVQSWKEDRIITYVLLEILEAMTPWVKMPCLGPLDLVLPLDFTQEILL